MQDDGVNHKVQNSACFTSIYRIAMLWNVIYYAHICVHQQVFLTKELNIRLFLMWSLTFQNKRIPKYHDNVLFSNNPNDYTHNVLFCDVDCNAVYIG